MSVTGGSTDRARTLSVCDMGGRDMTRTLSVCDMGGRDMTRTLSLCCRCGRDRSICGFCSQSVLRHG